MTHTLLIVDDEKDILETLQRQFRKDYKVFTATSGFEALKVLQKEKIHLIMSDQRMPEMTGVQMFEKAQILEPDAIRILFTGYTDVESVIAAINNGRIYRYVTKPWDPTELEIVVKRALESYDLKTELKEKNIKLEAALKELKTLDEAKSRFMILIGHELKTPLTTVNSFLSLLKEEVSAPEHKRYLERVSQGTDRLNEIVFDVLDLMSAETGQLKAKIQKLKSDALVQDILSLFQSQIEKKELKINLNIQNSNLNSDEVILKKILKKIIHNALKFSEPQSTITIKIAEPGQWSVENTGPTMTAEQIKKISKPFELDENILNHSQGLGLGLTVCQSLLKVLKSELEVTSKNGKTKVAFTVRSHPN